MMMFWNRPSLLLPYDEGCRALADASFDGEVSATVLWHVDVPTISLMMLEGRRRYHSHIR